MPPSKKCDLIAIVVLNGVSRVGGMRNHWIFYYCIVVGFDLVPSPIPIARNLLGATRFWHNMI